MANRRRHRPKGPEEPVQQSPGAKQTPAGPTAREALPIPRLLERAVTQPYRVTPGGMQALQRAFGNRAVTSLIPRSSRRFPIQARPILPLPGDPQDVRSTRRGKPGTTAQLSARDQGAATMVVQRKWTAKGTYQELVKDSDGKNTAENVLPNVALYQFSGGEYTPASEDMAGTLGITFPYGKPQQIHVWDSLDNDEEAAAVLYHEAKHAVDPKTPKLEDTKTAKTQDLVNEKEVWMSELKYRLRQGGKALKSALAEGVVKKNKSGKYEINETAVDKEIKGYESGYLTTNRKQRFDPTKYTWTGHKKIPWPPVFPADIKKREEEFSGLESKFEGAFVERLGRKITPQQYAMRLRVHLVFVKQLSERMREYKEYDPIKDKVKGLLTQVREDVQDHVNKSKRAKLLQLIGEIK